MRLEINDIPYLVDDVNERVLRKTMNCLKTTDVLPDFTPLEGLKELDSVKLFNGDGEEIELAYDYNYLVDVSIMRNPVTSFAITVSVKNDNIIDLSELSSQS